MKQRTTSTLVGVFFAILALTFVFTSTALAEKKHVDFNEKVMVNGTELKPGSYSVEWKGTGPEVQVSFLLEGKMITTAPAKLVSEKNEYDSSIDTTTSGDMKVLKRISFSKESLVFEAPTNTSE